MEISAFPIVSVPGRRGQRKKKMAGELYYCAEKSITGFTTAAEVGRLPLSRRPGTGRRRLRGCWERARGGAMEATADEGGLTGMQRAEALALLRTTLAIRSKLILQNPVRVEKLLLSARQRILRDAGRTKPDPPSPTRIPLLMCACAH